MSQFVPTFATALARIKVEKLMQPALIRVIDNIRKQLDVVTWKGSYEEELIWPDGTTPEQQQEYSALQKLLHGVPVEEHDHVSALMSELPQPSPLYRLKLQHADQVEQSIDIWDLCYQVCAVAYDPAAEVKADDSLFDELGEVDWLSLDVKTFDLVKAVFDALPA